MSAHFSILCLRRKHQKYLDENTPESIRRTRTVAWALETLLKGMLLQQFRLSGSVTMSVQESRNRI
jgi:hypothetical protein